MNAKAVLITVLAGALLTLVACQPTVDTTSMLEGAALQGAPLDADPGDGDATAEPKAVQETPTAEPKVVPPVQPGPRDAGSGGNDDGSSADRDAELKKLLRDTKVAASVEEATTLICTRAITEPQARASVPDLKKMVQQGPAGGLKNGWLAGGSNWETLLDTLSQYQDVNPSLKTFAQKLAGGQAVALDDACLVHGYAADEAGRLAKNQDGAGAAGGTSRRGIYAALANLGKPTSRTRLEYIEAECRDSGDDACLEQLKKLKASLKEACPQRAGCTDPVALALIYGKAPSNALHRIGVCPVGDCARIVDIGETCEVLFGPLAVDNEGGVAKPGRGGEGGGGNAGGGSQPGAGGAGGGAQPEPTKAPEDGGQRPTEVPIHP